MHESKNVVIAWMDELMSLATEGFNRNEDKEKNRYLSNIYSYCEAIRTCVSGK